MSWPFVSRLRLAAVEADRERIRAKYVRAAGDLAAARTAARTAARQFTDADRDLTDARKQLAGRGELLAKVPAVLEDHDARRKALAGVLGLQPSAEWCDVTNEAAALRTLLSRARSDAAALGSELAELREDGRAIDGGTVQPRTPGGEVLQERARADALAARLAEVTAVNQKCTCGGVS